MSLRLLGDVQAVLDNLHISSALIGAGAMGLHGYARSTEDLDLLVLDTTVLDEAFWKTLPHGCEVEVNAAGLHDDRDPLAGVVRVSANDGPDLVDVVVGKDPKWQRPILDHAVLAGFVAAPTVKVAQPADLVLLKLYAGGPQSERDILELLAAVPGLEATIEANVSAMPRGLQGAWKRLLKASKRDDPPRR